LLLFSGPHPDCNWLATTTLADLKPSNVLLKLDATGQAKEGVLAKLTDFGQSHVMCPGASHVSGHVGGTPWNVAPEVAALHRVSPASDMYAYGVLMWTLYSGCKPYEVDGVSGQAQRHAAFPGLGQGDPQQPPGPFTDLMHQ
jgi:serine/threonine protein kinase